MVPRIRSAFVSFLAGFFILTPTLATFGCKGETPAPLDPCLATGASQESCAAINSANPGASPSLKQCLANLSLSKPQDARAAVAGQAGIKETYCSVLASFQELLIQLGPLLDTVAGAFGGGGAPGYTPLLDASAILQSALKNILPRLHEMREGALKIVTGDEVKLNVPSLPLKIKVASLQTILRGSSGITIPPNLTLDLKGEYDRSHLMILGIIGAAIPGAVSFISAHDLNIDLSIIDILSNFDNLGELATYLVEKTPTLLNLKSGEVTKIQNEAKNLLLVTLKLAAGKPGSSTPGEDGLLAQIKRELKTEDKLSGKEVVAYIDKDGNGKFNRDDLLRISFVKNLFEQLGVTDETGDFENFLPEEGWQGLTNIGQDLLANLEGGNPAKPLSHLHPWLVEENRLNQDLFQSKTNPDGTPYGPIPLPPDWIAVDLKAYFANPRGLREFIPAIYDLGTTPPSGYSRYDFAFQCELAYTAEEYATPSTTGLPGNSTWRLLCGAQENTGRMFLKQIFFSSAPNNTTSAESEHFRNLVVSPATTASELRAPVLSDIIYATTDSPKESFLPIPPDGVFPERNPDGADGLLYVVLKDPTLGGILLVDPDPNPAAQNPGGNPQSRGTQQSVNTVIAKFQKNYLKYIILLINSL